MERWLRCSDLGLRSWQSGSDGRRYSSLLQRLAEDGITASISMTSRTTETTGIKGTARTTATRATRVRMATRATRATRASGVAGAARKTPVGVEMARMPEPKGRQESMRTCVYYSLVLVVDASIVSVVLRLSSFVRGRSPANGIDSAWLGCRKAKTAPRRCNAAALMAYLATTLQR